MGGPRDEKQQECSMIKNVILKEKGKFFKTVLKSAMK